MTFSNIIIFCFSDELNTIRSFFTPFYGSTCLMKPVHDYFFRVFLFVQVKKLRHYEANATFYDDRVVSLRQVMKSAAYVRGLIKFAAALNVNMWKWEVFFRCIFLSFVLVKISLGEVQAQSLNIELTWIWFWNKLGTFLVNHKILTRFY